MSTTAAATEPRPRSCGSRVDAPHLRLLRHARSCGQSAAVLTGVKAARGIWIATLDGDGQNDPADIPRLWRLAGTSPSSPPLLVAGYRQKRQDSWSKRMASRVANRVRSRLLGDATPDTGCGLKLFPRALFLDLPAFDHMHRFLPALVLRAGGTVRSVPVNHRPRQRRCVEIRRLRPPRRRDRRSLRGMVAAAPKRPPRSGRRGSSARRGVRDAAGVPALRRAVTAINKEAAAVACRLPAVAALRG